MTVRDIDHGFDRLVAQLAKLDDGVSVTVGIHEEEGAAAHPTSDATVVEVGALAEFGTIDQPPRSFIRAPFDANVARTQASMVRAACDVAKGKGLEEAFGAVGTELLGSMVEQFDRVAPLDEGTVEEKGSSEPLVETGTVKESLLSRVNGRVVS